ncbi:hypothetical protein PM082_007046 [Marasmius tenuissimus]|nr:hypothetical protein PM082_007046 [Marasmius tenuissimus]
MACNVRTDNLCLLEEDGLARQCSRSILRVKVDKERHVWTLIRVWYGLGEAVLIVIVPIGVHRGFCVLSRCPSFSGRASVLTLISSQLYHPTSRSRSTSSPRKAHVSVPARATAVDTRQLQKGDH